MDRKNGDWTIIRALRHARHDWINHIQLIKGYIALGKIEEAERAIEQTAMQAKQEAHLCNLPWPGFVEMLVTFNWEERAFQLEYEVLDTAIQAQLDDCYLTRWMSTLFRLIEGNVEQYADNHLYLSIAEADEGIRFFFEFSGIITDAEALIPTLKEAVKAPAIKRGNIHSYSAEEIQFEVIM